MKQTLFGVPIPDKEEVIEKEVEKKVESKETELKEFADEKGSFHLNGVLISYEFKNDYFEKENPKVYGCPHLEFNSYQEKGKTKIRKPNTLTPTGYRSYFFDGGCLTGYNSILEFIKDYAEAYIKSHKVKRGEKKPTCDFEESLSVTEKYLKQQKECATKTTKVSAIIITEKDTEKDIKTYSEKLKKALTIKYGDKFEGLQVKVRK